VDDAVRDCDCAYGIHQSYKAQRIEKNLAEGLDLGRIPLSEILSQVREQSLQADEVAAGFLQILRCQPSLLLRFVQEAPDRSRRYRGMRALIRPAGSPESAMRTFLPGDLPSNALSPLVPLRRT
jgi:hypothetical protein